MILIDTNVISELMRAEPAQPVLDWFAKYDAVDLFISAVTEAELRTGVAILPEGQRRDRLQLAINAMMDQDFQGRVLPFDSTAAKAYAEIAAQRRASGRPISCLYAILEMDAPTKACGRAGSRLDRASAGAVRRGGGIVCVTAGYAWRPER